MAPTSGGETGPGVGAATPQHSGFGLSMPERTLPRELNAKVTIMFALRDLTCRIHSYGGTGPGRTTEWRLDS